MNNRTWTDVDQHLIGLNPNFEHFLTGFYEVQPGADIAPYADFLLDQAKGDVPALNHVEWKGASFQVEDQHQVERACKTRGELYAALPEEMRFDPEVFLRLYVDHDVDGAWRFLQAIMVLPIPHDLDSVTEILSRYQQSNRDTKNVAETLSQLDQLPDEIKTDVRLVWWFLLRCAIEASGREHRIPQLISRSEEVSPYPFLQHASLLSAIPGQLSVDAVVRNLDYCSLIPEDLQQDFVLVAALLSFRTVANNLDNFVQAYQILPGEMKYHPQVVFNLYYVAKEFLQLVELLGWCDEQAIGELAKLLLDQNKMSFIQLARMSNLIVRLDLTDDIKSDVDFMIPLLAELLKQDLNNRVNQFPEGLLAKVAELGLDVAEQKKWLLNVMSSLQPKQYSMLNRFVEQYQETFPFAILHPNTYRYFDGINKAFDALFQSSLIDLESFHGRMLVQEVPSYEYSVLFLVDLCRGFGDEITLLGVVAKVLLELGKYSDQLVDVFEHYQHLYNSVFHQAAFFEAVVVMFIYANKYSDVNVLELLNVAKQKCQQQQASGSNAALYKLRKTSLEGFIKKVSIGKLPMVEIRGDERKSRRYVSGLVCDIARAFSERNHPFCKERDIGCDVVMLLSVLGNEIFGSPEDEIDGTLQQEGWAHFFSLCAEQFADYGCEDFISLLGMFDSMIEKQSFWFVPYLEAKYKLLVITPSLFEFDEDTMEKIRLQKGEIREAIDQLPDGIDTFVVRLGLYRSVSVEVREAIGYEEQALPPEDTVECKNMFPFQNENPRLT